MAFAGVHAILTATSTTAPEDNLAENILQTALKLMDLDDLRNGKLH